MSGSPVRARPSRGSRRLNREKRTVQLMITMHCRAQHAPGARSASVTTLGGTTLCPDCALLLDYTHRRLDACRFGERKPPCARCPVHCFRATDRETIRQVMRYSGPRMLWRHPCLAVRHLLDRHHTPQTAA